MRKQLILSSLVFLASCGESYDADKLTTESNIIFGNDDRVQVLKITSETPPVGQLRIKYKDVGNDISICTASLISPRYLATSSHCFVNKELKYAKTASFHLHSLESSRNSNEYLVKKVHLNKKYIDTINGDSLTNISEDVAVVELEKPIYGVQPFEIDPDYIDFYAFDGFFFTYGYPGDKPLGTLWRTECDEVEIYKNRGFFGGENEDVFNISCDMVKGQSGSPIFDDEYLLGIIQGTIKYSDEKIGKNLAVRLSERHRESIQAVINNQAQDVFKTLELELKDERYVNFIFEKCNQDYDLYLIDGDTKFKFDLDVNKGSKLLAFKNKEIYFYATSKDQRSAFGGSEPQFFPGLGERNFMKIKLGAYQSKLNFTLRCN